MSQRESNSLMAAVSRRKTGRAGWLAVHLIVPLLRETRLKKGLVAVPGVSDGELLRPAAGCFSQGGKIMSVGGMEDLFCEGVGLARCAVARDDVFRCQLREARKAGRNDGQAGSQGFHQGNRETFVDGGKYEEIEVGEKTGDIETGAVKEDTVRDSE